MIANPKFNIKELNIAALQSGMRKYGGPGCSCHCSDIINSPRVYRKKRLFRKEAGYISK